MRKNLIYNIVFTSFLIYNDDTLDIYEKKYHRYLLVKETNKNAGTIFF